MPDDPTKNLDTGAETWTDDIPEPDEIMEPAPVASQNALWEYLDAVVDVPALERERRFIDVKPELQLYLASAETAKQIQEISRKANLNGEQTQSLARSVRDLFIGEVTEGEFDVSLAKALGMELSQTRDIKSGLASILEMFRKNAKRGPTPLAPAGGMRESTPFASGTPKPQIGAAEPMPPALRTGGAGAVPQAPLGDTRDLRREEPTPETPFMIHVERDEAMPFAMPVPPLPPKPRPAPQRGEAKPVRVKVETPGAKPAPPPPPKEKPQSRVVHYSNLRTPIE